MRVCITPRWGGGPDDHWYPWLVRSLRDHDAIVARLKPNPRAPTLEACVEELLARLGSDPLALADTVLVGHSVGCQANLRFLASLPAGSRLAGVLCVAGWWWIDEPWDAIRPWIETPHDLARVRAASPGFVTLLSDNDPFTSDQARNGAVWRERLGAEVRWVEGARHFLRAREPAVLDALRDLSIRTTLAR